MADPAAEPTEPIEPVEPTEPIEPIEPVEPAEPVEPTEPVEPKEPTEPIEPTEPAKRAPLVDADGNEVVEIKRFNEIYGHMKRTERENERLKSSIPETTQAVPATVPKPKEDDFESYALYEEAVLDWKLDKRDAARNASQQETDAKSQKEEFFKKVDDKVSDAVAKDPDFFKKAYIPEKFAALLSDSDKFADFGYYFADNMEEVKKLLDMPSDLAAMEIGKLEASFKMPKQKTKTNAPDPTKSLGGSTTVSKDPNKMSMAEYKEWRKSGGGT